MTKITMALIGLVTRVTEKTIGLGYTKKRTQPSADVAAEHMCGY